MEQTKTWKKGLIASAVLLVILLVVGLTVSSGNSGSESATPVAPPSTQVDVQPASVKCANSWEQASVDNGNNRWFANGVPAIAEATTPEQARAAATTWVNAVRTNAVLLSGASVYVLKQSVNQAELFDANGCATSKAVDLVAQMTTALALSKITPSQAPSNGFNSGVAGGQVVAASTAGITGDRRAILIELPNNGGKVWVMSRCGNPVTEGKPPVPSGPTDEKPPPPTVPPKPPVTTKPKPPVTTTTKPPPPPTTVPPKKDPSKDVLNNPNVPPEVKGPGTTPVGQNPGPATPPVDSPTGCAGPCPGSTPSSSPPPSGGGKTTVPSCGQAGQPSCFSTGVTPPTTTQPPAPPPPDSAPNQGPIASP